MSPVDFTNILDEDFPPVDVDSVTPTVAAVALLERTRTVDQSSTEQGTFTTTTRPTAAEVETLIDQAVVATLADMPDFLPTVLYPQILQAVAYQTAVLIELSFYREQYHQGSAQGYEQLYDKLLKSILLVSGGSAGGQRVDSIMARSTMAEYAPDYPMPPPRVMPRTPLPIDGEPDDEGQGDN